MLPFDIVRNVFHRTRAVQGVHGDQVLELVGLQLAQVFLHARTFKLEGPDGFAALVKLEGQRIVQRKRVEIDLHAVVEFDQFQRGLENVEGLQTQEVHLDDPRLLDHTAFDLGDPKRRILRRADRHKLRQVLRGDDDAGSMESRIPDRSLQDLRFMQDPAVQVLTIIYVT